MNLIQLNCWIEYVMPGCGIGVLSYRVRDACMHNGLLSTLFIGTVDSIVRATYRVRGDSHTGISASGNLGVMTIINPTSVLSKHCFNQFNYNLKRHQFHQIQYISRHNSLRESNFSVKEEYFHQQSIYLTGIACVYITQENIFFKHVSNFHLQVQFYTKISFKITASTSNISILIQLLPKRPSPKCHVLG